MQLSESDLIDLILKKETELFGVLIKKYSPYLYKIGRSYKFNHQDTEDLVQESFIKAFENLSKLEHREYFKTWLIKIMLNECYRKNRRPFLVKEIIVDSFFNDKTKLAFLNTKINSTEKIITDWELNKVIKNAIENIPPIYKHVFSLRELGGMNVFETGDALNITETNVKVRLSRAKAMLRKEVGKIYTSEEILQLMH